MGLRFGDGVGGGVFFLLHSAVGYRLGFADPNRLFFLHLAGCKTVWCLWYLQGGAFGGGGAGGGGSYHPGEGGGRAGVVCVSDEDRPFLFPDCPHSPAGLVGAILVGAGNCAVFESLCVVVCVHFLVDSSCGAFRGAGKIRVSFAVVALADAVLDAAACDLAADDVALVFGGLVFTPTVFASRGFMHIPLTWCGLRHRSQYAWYKSGVHSRQDLWFPAKLIRRAWMIAVAASFFQRQKLGPPSLTLSLSGRRMC